MRRRVSVLNSVVSIVLQNDVKRKKINVLNGIMIIIPATVLINTTVECKVHAN